MNMPFLKDIPPFIFFTGKGGVGKTSLACATAVWLADQGKRTLLVSTDPASNVGQVFSQTIGHRITDITTVENLAAMEVDPMAAAQAYRDRVLDPVRGLMPADVVSSIEEQLSGSCTTEIAAFDEFTGLLTNHELREKYDHIVFDTAPTGHTIRMLELPGAWNGYLEANPDAAANLGPLVGLEKQQHQYSDAVKALSDAALTRLLLVARAQASTLKRFPIRTMSCLLSVCSINTLPLMVCCRRLRVRMILWRKVFWRGKKRHYRQCPIIWRTSPARSCI